MDRQLLIKRILEGDTDRRSSSDLPENANKHLGPADRKWMCLDEFLLVSLLLHSSKEMGEVQDHVREALLKLLKELERRGERDGHDRIWGKLILMERGNRLAKVNLRERMVVVNGGDEEFDGKTLGCNHFAGVDTNEREVNFRRKIGDGLILKITNHGSIKAMALGTAPIYLLDWDDVDGHCFPESIFRTQGILPRKPSGADSGHVAKLFDFQRFIEALDEYEEFGGEPSDLLCRACIRVAMVKKSSRDWDKHPAWFLLININALALLAKRAPALCYEFLARRDPNEKIRSAPKVARSSEAVRHDENGGDRKVELMLAKMLADALEKVTHMQTSMFERMAQPITTAPKAVEEATPTHKREESDEEEEDEGGRSKIHMALRGSRKRHKRPALTHTLFRKPLNGSADGKGNDPIFTSDYESSNRGGDDDSGSFLDSLSGSSTASWGGEATIVKPKPVVNVAVKGYYYCDNEEEKPSIPPPQKRLPRIHFTHDGDIHREPENKHITFLNGSI